MKRFQHVTFFACVLAILATGCGPSPANHGNSNGNTTANTIVNPSPLPIQCDATVDTRIEEALTNVVLADRRLHEIKRNFNFDSMNCKVFLSGWTGTTELFKELEKQTANVANVSAKDNVEFWVLATEARIKGSSGCASGYQPCGDICIPNGQTCHTDAIPDLKKTSK